MLSSAKMAKTRFLQSWYHTPSAVARELFVVVLRAGHLQAAPDYRIERRACAGHDLLLCLKGGGWISAGGKEFAVVRGQLAWLQGRYPHAHWADPPAPWHLLWARIDGTGLDRLAAALGVQRSPVFCLAPEANAVRRFRAVLRLMRTRPRALEALLHVEVTCLLGALFATRLGEAEPFQELPPGLRIVIEHLSVHYHRPWRVEVLAREAGMSVPHFFRRFRQATGLTPINYLRRERINHAKRRLVESTDSIKEIAEQTGYLDQFYFSREFKKLTGECPSAFRRRESDRKAVRGAGDRYV